MTCGKSDCIRYDDDNLNAAVCQQIIPVIDPSLSCIPVRTNVKCTLSEALSENFTWFGKWEFRYRDDYVSIIDDLISFPKSMDNTESYECRITIGFSLPLQTFSKWFSFQVYDEQAFNISLDIKNNIVFLGQNITCFVSGWKQELITFNIFTSNPGVYLDKVLNGVVQVNITSKLVWAIIFCEARLRIMCKERPNINTSVSMAVTVKTKLSFGWESGDRNIFHRKNDTDPFACGYRARTRYVKSKVTILHQPKVSDNDVILNGSNIPGPYYISCDLQLLGPQSSFIIYKYLNIYYFPEINELSAVSDGNYFDSMIKCLPLPFPEEDYEYSIIVYNGSRESGVIGSFNTHTIESPGTKFKMQNVITVKCIMRPKYKGRYKMIEKSTVMNLKGWKNPIVLNYSTWRVQAYSFYAAVIAMILLVSLSWIIHMNSTGSLSENYLCSRTEYLSCMRRRNMNFHLKLIEWLDSLNSLFYNIGIVPLSANEAFALISSDRLIARDFFQFTVGEKINTSGSAGLKEKSKMYQDTISRLRRIRR